MDAINKIKGFLLTAGIITEAQWNDALKISQNTGERIEKVLVEKEFITQQEAFEILELVYDAPYINLARELVELDALMLVPKDVALTNKLMPISVTPGQMVVAMANPQDLMAIDNIRFLTSLSLKVYFAFEEDIIKAIEVYYEKMNLLPTPDIILEKGVTQRKQRITEATKREVIGAVKFDAPANLRPVQEKSALEMVDDIFKMAIECRATDIHFEPVPDGLLLRFRIYGRLHDVQIITPSTAEPIPLRIKVMTDLNIADPSTCLQNECDLKVGEKILRVRASVIRTADGERINCKILNQKHTFANFWNLVLDEKSFKPLQDILRRNKGLLLLASPPGSDSESTLFAILHMIANQNKSIIIIGKGMNLQFKGINYIRVTERFNYIDAIKTVVNQDPDVILIDKLSDRDTIEMAFRLALSGQVVLSTLETYFHSAETICGLMKKGISPFWIASALNGIITQRWASKICPYCKTEHYLGEDDWRWEFLDMKTKAKKVRLYSGRGCNFCDQTGYYGCIGIYEVLNMTKRVKSELIKRPIPDAIHRLAEKEGMESLKDNAMKYVWNGQLNLDDIFEIVI
ncbi:MAG: ATPase, T2SS/T4P/T4SS family [Candidatus Eremiobacterota bacterium]